MPSYRRPSARQVAVALGYDIGLDHAPVIRAKGRDRSARRIIELARESKIPIHEDADLANLLVLLPTGREIPPALYHAVAEVLAFIYTMNESHGKEPPVSSGGSAGGP